MLEALHLRYSDLAVEVDRTTFNAARISKLYGTLAAKGDSTAERPHRMSALLEVPDEIGVVSRELLERLAAEVQPKTKTKSTGAVAAEPSIQRREEAGFNAQDRSQDWIQNWMASRDPIGARPIANVRWRHKVRRSVSEQS